VSAVTALALIVGLGGLLVVVYFTTEIAVMFLGSDPLPISLRRFGSRVDSTNRITRSTFLVLFLGVLEAVVVAVLLTRQAELDGLSTGLFVTEVIGACVWTAWLVRRYRAWPRE